MIYFGFILMIFGIVYGIYVHRTRRGLNIYLRGKIKSVQDSSEYYRMQYLVGIINSAILVISGLIFFMIYASYSMISIFLLVGSTMVFNFNNYLLLKLADNRGIIEKSS